MPTLLDHIDRFSYTAQEIQKSCQQVSINPTGPYVRAVLHTPIGDKARDIDASEIGLFTLVRPAAAQSHVLEEGDAAGVAVNEVARVEFPGATPLRRPAGLTRGVKKDEKDPEVYAEAALKYLDRYQSIRPMPRARHEILGIIERLNVLRDEISKLSDAVQESGQSDTNPFPTVKEEERRIQELHLRLKQMRARKDVLLKKQGGASSSKPTGSSAFRANDSQEDAFWSEPAPRSFKARQSLLIPSDPSEGDESLLLDANIDMDKMGAMIGDMSLESISEMPTPLPPPRPPSTTKKVPAPYVQGMSGKASNENAESKRRTSVVNAARTLPRSHPKVVPKPAPEPEPRPRPEPVPEPEPESKEVDDDDEEFDGEDEKTVVLKKPPPPSPPSPPPAVHTPSPKPTRSSTPPEVCGSKGKAPEPTTPAQPQNGGNPVTPATERRKRPMITTEVERIVAKIWSTVGDMIMPGHPFKTASAATTKKPPRAKETIALLQNISSQQPSPTSPSTHSTLSLTTHTHDAHHLTTQQILTAHLLLTLLAAPDQALPLNKAKEALAARGLGAPAPAPGTTAFSLAGLGAGGQGLESRALYGCVAKRLLKIDRGAREQIVRFNI